MKLDTKFQEKLGAMFAVPAGESELPGALLVDIEKIKVAAQPREYFNEAALKDLENSIRELYEAGKGLGGTGILQPLLVRSAVQENGHNANEYIVTAGERRLRAAKAVGLRQIPVVIDDVSTEEAWEHAIIENLLRADLSPLEEAHALNKLIQTRGYSVREAAKRLGKDKGYLENRLFLLKAPPDVQAMVSARADTIRHAREICRISEVTARQKLIEAALTGASVLEIQARVQNLVTPKEKPAKQETKEKKDLLKNKGLSAHADSEVLLMLTQSVQKVKLVVESLPAEITSSKSSASESAAAKNAAAKNRKNIRQHFVQELREQIGELQKLVERIEEDKG